jgi:hypothetical protein
MSSRAGAADSVLHGARAAWDWLQAQLAGRAVPPVLTIVGLGDCSVLDALDAHAPGTKVLAVEPDPARAALTHRSVDAWRRSGRLVYLVAPQFAGADQGWRIFPTRFEEPPLLVHPASAASQGLRAAVTVLRKIAFGAKANADARRRFAPRYLVNSIRNLPGMLAGRDVRELAGWADGVPAIVIGAGPSLDQSLGDLKRLGAGAVIIATDTALRPLLARGIVPQLVVALDPSEINCRHLLRLPPCRDTWLVAESALDPRATVEFNGRTFWFRVAPHQPWPWLNALGIDIGRLDVWGSVLTAAFQIAALAGCDPIVMVGADLSFPGGRPYARGTTYEYDWAWAAAHGTPVEEVWAALLEGRRDVRIERDLTRVETPTSAVMLQFRDWLVAQGRKRGRHLVNATGRGLLFGDGVEQAPLSEAFPPGAPPALPLVRCERQPATGAALASSLRDIRAALAAGESQREPLASWQEFSGEGFDADHLAAAVSDASRGLDGQAGASASSVTSSSRQRDDALLEHLPEAASRFRSVLGGAPGASRAPLATRVARLIEALARLEHIARSVAGGPDLVSLPDPSLVGKVSAAGIVMWADTTRWAAFEFEALLADAWDRAVQPPGGIALDDAGVLLPDSLVAAAPGPPPVTRLYAHHGCVLLAFEWVACASSLADSAGLRAAAERLWGIQALLQRAVWSPLPSAPSAELVLQVTSSGCAVDVALPLGVCDAALARIMTGAMRAEGDEAWEIGADTIGGFTVRVMVRSQTGPRELPVRRVAPAVPRKLNLGPGRRLKVAGETDAGVLCVVDFGTETVRIDADGTIQAYQVWPRTITGALSLGADGDVAWSNVANPRRGVTPYLMYRPAADAEVVVVPLDFRPARGLWWRDRLYLTCLPGADGQAGLASWAPGEQPSMILRGLLLQGIVPSGESLWLEPFVPGAGESVARRHAERGWQWTPGSEPAPRVLGPLGASSDSAAAGDWTAAPHPQADVVVLERRDGTRVQLRCYNPSRVGWAGGSLVVFGGDGETLLFEQLLAAIEV